MEFRVNIASNKLQGFGWGLDMPATSPPTIKPLKVIVSGGGPSGLIFACTLSNYAIKYEFSINIIIYEKRIKNENGIWKWKSENEGNKRRCQIVILQNNIMELLPQDMQEFLCKNIKARVWPNSRNLPIREVEDQLLEFTQNYSNIQFIPLELNSAELEKQVPFDCLVGADGYHSFVKKQFDFQVTDIPQHEYALGVSIVDSNTAHHQSVNVLLTLSQTKFLFSSCDGRSGYVNIRLTKEETEEFDKYGSDIIGNDSLPLWQTVLQALKFFNLQPDAVASVNRIDIKLQHAMSFTKQLPDQFKNGRSNKPALAFLIGDSAIPVHFWPGRGLNIGARAALGLARRLFWAHRGSNRFLNPTGEIKIIDFAFFEGLMASTRLQEVQGRSLSIMNGAPVCTIKENAPDMNGKEKYKEVLIKLADFFEARKDWPHETLPRDWVDFTINNLSPSAISMLLESKPWPTEEMYGTPEISIFDPCPLLTA